MRFGIREVIFLIVLLAVPALSFLFLFKPRNDAIRQMRSETEVKQARLDELEAVTASIADLDLEIQKGQESIEQLEDKLPKEQDVESVVEQVWRIAQNNNLIVKGVKSEKPVPAAMYRERPLKWSIEGSFDGFYQFLLELENLPRITRMPLLHLERAGYKGSRDNLEPGSMKAELTLNIYFEPDGGSTQ